MSSGTGAILIYVLIFFGIFYFLAIRPQRKQRQQHANLVAMLKKGDQVVTVAGMFGSVTAIGDDWVELEIARRTRVRFLKRAVASVTAIDDEDDDEDEYVDADEDEYLESDADVVEDEPEPAVEEPVAEVEAAQPEQAPEPVDAQQDPEAPQPPKA